MKIRNALILLAFTPALLAHGRVSFKHELAVDDIFSWLRGGGNNFKTESKLRRRDDDADTCSNSGASQPFLIFNGIFFGNFTTTNGYDSSGPLAVRDTMSGTEYFANRNHNSNCSDVEHNLNGYGLVVGGRYNGNGDRVRGATYLPDGTDTSKTYQIDNSCPIVTDKGTGLFNFDQVYTNAIEASKKIAGLSPTLLLDNNGVLSRLSNPVGNFDVVTMNTCRNGCTFYADQLSDPTNMLYGFSNWNGPQGMSWPAVLIINIPVTTGSTINIAGDQPSAGISPCTTIYNIYPADTTGNYSPGRIYINRNTAGKLAGLTLAPEADIHESGTGNFAGQLIANNYDWLGTGVELQNYTTFGGNCTGFLGCLPIWNNTTPRYPGDFIVITPISSSSEDLGTVTDPTPSSPENFSTVSIPYIFSSTRSSITILSDSAKPLSTIHDTITELPASSLNTDRAVSDSFYISVTAVANISYFDTSSTSVNHNTLPGVYTSTSITDKTNSVLTEKTTSSSSIEFRSSNESLASSKNVTRYISATNEEGKYCTYGGYPHFHKDEEYGYYDHQEYNDLAEKKNQKNWRHKHYYHDHYDEYKDEHDDEGDDEGDEGDDEGDEDDDEGDEDDDEDDEDDNDDEDNSEDKRNDGDEEEDEDEDDENKDDDKDNNEYGCEDEEHNHGKRYHKEKDNKE